MTRTSAPKRLIPMVQERAPRSACIARRRRAARPLLSVLLGLAGVVAIARPVRATPSPLPTPQWGIFELTLKASPKIGGPNPSADVRFSAWFFQDGPQKEVVGFYDGHDTFRVRFMPPKPGVWHYTTVSSLAALEGQNGEFTVSATPSVTATPSVKQPTPAHGPVGISSRARFAYADGTPFEPHGTTAALAALATDAQRQKTLKMLTEGAFNKIRLAVLPRSSEWPRGAPPLYPFEGKPHHFNSKRFNPAYFQRLERVIADLERHGIEADVILSHAEDDNRWGFDQLSAEDQELYLRYVTARLAPFHNVWWSLANEFDRLKSLGSTDFDRLGARLVASDPYHHLLSVQSGGPLFDYKRPWITHVSVSAEAAAAGSGHGAISAQTFGKPVVIDASH